MKITLKDDQYVCHHLMLASEFDEAFYWCLKSFGSNFGYCHFGDVDRLGRAICTFSFHKMYHAQWFQLKFGFDEI